MGTMKYTDHIRKHQESSSSSKGSYNQQYVLFRIGKLRFGLHGILGILALTFTLIAYYLYSTNIAIIMISQFLNGIIAMHATTLLPQVPPFTEILPGIVAPHKEAFKRTIAVMHYLVARVTLKVCAPAAAMLILSLTTSSSDNNDNNNNNFDTVYRYLSCAVLAWFWWPLVPSKDPKQWTNGNTWIFIVPIFVGVTADLGQFMYLSQDLMRVEQLLQTQLLGLVLAFGFTLAFRNYVGMPTVYLGAALGVWKVLVDAFVTIQAGTAAAVIE
jgi:hypothetical protein